MSTIFRFVFSIIRIAIVLAIGGDLTVATKIMLHKAVTAQGDQISFGKLNRALMGSHQKCLSAKCRR